MTKRELLARMLCKNHGVNPDQKTVGIKGKLKDKEYFLWEYQAIHYVDPILEELENENASS